MTVDITQDEMNILNLNGISTEDVRANVEYLRATGMDDNTSDYISEGLMKSVIHSSLIASKDQNNYEAMSNIMWSATWALNTLISRGKSTDWMVHMIGQAIGGVTNATHGMTLSSVSLAYYRYIMPYGLAKFVRFAKNVFNVDPANKTDEEIALGLSNCNFKWRLQGINKRRY